MTEQEINELISAQGFPDLQHLSEKKETHISWVLLCQEFVYKIKKPVKFSFLDFSTLEQRKYFCEREVQLNRRLAPLIYLDSIPVCQDKSGFRLHPPDCPGIIVDYAVRMKRMDNSREMGLLLSRGEVRVPQLEKLAIQLAIFHQNTAIVHLRDPAQSLFEDFQDLRNVRSFVEKYIGMAGARQLDQLIEFASEYTTGNKSLIEDRCKSGYIRDCHGDLHSGNIILSEEPVIFDCIEFNDHFRQIDILNELAFFCMDLEFYDREDLASHFLDYYCREFPIFDGPGTKNLFLFYKLYRANVKTKVNALKHSQTPSSFDQKDRLVMFKKYFLLMVNYYELLLKNSHL